MSRHSRQLDSEPNTADGESRVSYHADRVMPQGAGLVHFDRWNPSTGRYETNKVVAKRDSEEYADIEGPFKPAWTTEKVEEYKEAVTRNVGKKYDAGKAPVVQGFVAYFARAIKAVAMISKYGTEKYEVEYSDQGFKKVPNAIGRYSDGLGRHLTDEAIDGLYDPESGYLHAAHVAWNGMARLDMMLESGIPLRREDGTEQT